LVHRNDLPAVLKVSVDTKGVTLETKEAQDNAIFLACQKGNSPHDTYFTVNPIGSLELPKSTTYGKTKPAPLLHVDVEYRLTSNLTAQTQFTLFGIPYAFRKKHPDDMYTLKTRTNRMRYKPSFLYVSCGTGTNVSVQRVRMAKITMRTRAKSMAINVHGVDPLVFLTIFQSYTNS
jgi:hypothetical protein